MLMCIAHFVDAERHIASYDFKPLSTIAARSTCTSHEDKRRYSTPIHVATVVGGLGLWSCDANG